MKLDNLTQLTEEQLDEVRMSPSAIKQFLASPDAEGIKAGFEAELIFKGINEPTYEEESEPDYDMDERAYSIESVTDFFRGGDYGMSRREADRLAEKMNEEYLEWRSEQIDDKWADEGEEYFKDYVATNDLIDESELIISALEYADFDDEEIEKILDPKVREENPVYKKAYFNAVDAAAEEIKTILEDMFNSKGREYQSAFDDFVEYHDDEFDQETWLDDNYRYMSDVRDGFDLDWPYYIYHESSGDGDFNLGVAENLAQSLSTYMKMNDILPDIRVKAQGYHSSRPTGSWENTWYIESDGSLSPDDDEDMPCEIVSPPLPLQQTLQVIPAFFEWAKENDAYANESTGFHMGVSLSTRGAKKMYVQQYGRSHEQQSYDFDYLKAILFLGEEHLLSEFNRLGNTYCVRGMKRASNILKDHPSKIDDVFNVMRHGLIELASDLISKSSMHKYTTINPHDKYVEFRIAGGEDYIDEIERLQQTLGRYAYVMHIAGDNHLFRDEYYKKLYKFLSSVKGDEGSEFMKLFAQYTSGMIDKNELKMAVHQSRIEAGKPLPQRHEYYVYRVSIGGEGYARVYPPMEVVAKNTEQAKQRAWDQWPHTDSNDKRKTVAKILRPYTGPKIEEPEEKEDYNSKDIRGEVYKAAPNGEFTGRWLILDGATQKILHTVSGIGNVQADANRFASNWLVTQPESVRSRSIEVVPEIR